MRSVHGYMYSGNTSQNVRMYSRCLLQVVVDFRGGLFGSFSQWLGLDVGERPVVVRKLNIELGTRLVNHDVRSLREKLQFDRLDTKNIQ